MTNSVYDSKSKVVRVKSKTLKDKSRKEFKVDKKNRTNKRVVKEKKRKRKTRKKGSYL